MKATISFFLIFLVFETVQAEDWPHWRGPNRNDITTESSGWNGKNWPGKVAWKIKVGVGCSSPIIVGSKMYALGWKNNTDFLYCLDAVTGKQLWQQNYRCPPYGRKATGDQGQYKGPSSTPEFDKETGFLYTLSTDGDLNCWDTQQKGQKVWGVNLFEKYRIERRPRVGRSGLRDYGYTTAPLIYRDWVLVEVGAREGSVVAFDKRTGLRQWISDLKDPPGHAGGLVPMTVEGVPCVAVFTHGYLAVIRLDQGHEGETVATYPWKTDFANSIATPAVHENYVLITSAYNHFTICKLEITLKGAKRLWETDYASGVCSPIIYKNHVYWAWRKIHCLDFETGKLKWSGGRFDSPGSCIITGDEMLIAWVGRGSLFLAETAENSPNRLTVLAEKTNVARDLVWPHVILANGRLYCKDRKVTITCFQVD